LALIVVQAYLSKPQVFNQLELLICVRLSPNLFVDAITLRYSTPHKICAQVAHSHQISQFWAKSLMVFIYFMALSNSGAVQQTHHHLLTTIYLLCGFLRQKGQYSSARRCDHALDFVVND
jgi:hypothetical protein